MEQAKSYLIVGQGIAGSLLAWPLMQAGHTVVIVDQDHQGSSSMVSAGLINPITGQRLVVTPQFDLYSAHAQKTYALISAELGKDFFIPKPIIRILRDQGELERCRHLNTLPNAQPYIDGIHAPGHYGTALNDPYGTLTISRGGYFQTRLLLRALREYFNDRKMIVSERFSYEDLVLTDRQPTWKSQQFNAVIFCEGYKAGQNPWFKDLPYNFVKGELIRVAFDAFSPPDAILCQQQWCIPSQDGTYLAGSTYDREHIDTIPTEEGQAAIIKGLGDFIPGKARILETFAGVRPVMLDQKPVMLMHPSIRGVGIFNGFGSKGFLWAPYYAGVFAKKLI